ncbi:fatty acid hydroxylase superfamily-domain-containing protein [Dactylonectria estremocensis]|uniref:Fatty acid hydroxylase superfamily-domain-containing protein n=1 Tax=Dactylonectria estremocensis TaxID=1079267 RepID=A0A9P9IHL3_9HYPO|nr:fatty acid hydroxylase superfamily-domain-containing protein [Dactylonectria estremocensis]
MSAIWAELVKNYNHASIEIVGTLVIQVLFWWIPSIIYVSLDHVAPSFAARHKIQPLEKQPTAAVVGHAVAVSLRNQLSIIAVQIAISIHSALHDRPSRFQITPTLPTTTSFIKDIFICIISREILFYYSHRLFHMPYFYRRIHKVHHKFKAPVSFASQYAHPIEHVVANVMPIALPPAILGTHIATMWAFLAFELLETATVHSGYDFFRGAARRHDRHHERFDVNFGGMPWLDYLHGTSEESKDSIGNKE